MIRSEARKRRTYAKLMRIEQYVSQSRYRVQGPRTAYLAIVWESILAYFREPIFLLQIEFGLGVFPKGARDSPFHCEAPSLERDLAGSYLTPWTIFGDSSRSMNSSVIVIAQVSSPSGLNPPIPRIAFALARLSLGPP